MTKDDFSAILDEVRYDYMKPMKRVDVASYPASISFYKPIKSGERYSAGIYDLDGIGFILVVNPDTAEVIAEVRCSSKTKLLPEIVLEVRKVYFKDVIFIVGSDHQLEDTFDELILLSSLVYGENPHAFLQKRLMGSLFKEYCDRMLFKLICKKAKTFVTQSIAEELREMFPDFKRSQFSSLGPATTAFLLAMSIDYRY